MTNFFPSSTHYSKKSIAQELLYNKFLTGIKRTHEQLQVVKLVKKIVLVWDNAARDYRSAFHFFETKGIR